MVSGSLATRAPVISTGGLTLAIALTLLLTQACELNASGDLCATCGPRDASIDVVTNDDMTTQDDAASAHADGGALGDDGRSESAALLDSPLTDSTFQDRGEAPSGEAAPESGDATGADAPVDAPRDAPRETGVDGGSCGIFQQCASGCCVDGTCQQVQSGTGGMCCENASCESRNCIAAGALALTCGPPACAATGSCAQGSFCDDGAAGNGECCSRTCNGNRCQTSMNKGDPCCQNGDCASGTCKNGRCGP